MDRDWMRERLTEFGGKVYTYSKSLDPAGHWGPSSEALWMQIGKSEPTIRKIFEALDPALAHQFDLDALAGDVEARRLVQRALGILEDMDEWAVRLRPESPVLLADQFHPWVWAAAQPFWETEHYRSAVDAAARAINAHTQTKIGRTDIFNDDLMNQAFTEKPKAGQVYLRLPGDSAEDQTLKSRNNALRPFAAGCFAGIRNPASHEYGDDWSEQKALEYLAALSILARWIEECEVRYGT
jgi:uncharacterized protein (TIGR02391 family)